jgi:hypothetical protein
VYRIFGFPASAWWQGKYFFRRHPLDAVHPREEYASCAPKGPKRTKKRKNAVFTRTIAISCRSATFLLSRVNRTSWERLANHAIGGDRRICEAPGASQFLRAAGMVRVDSDRVDARTGFPRPE